MSVFYSCLLSLNEMAWQVPPVQGRCRTSMSPGRPALPADLGSGAGASAFEVSGPGWSRQPLPEGPLTSRSRPLEMTLMVPVLRWTVNMRSCGSFGS